MSYSTQNEMYASGPYKFGWVTLYAVVYLVFYVAPNLRPLFPPYELPMLAVDRAIPFVPATFWIYLSDYILVLSVVFLITDLRTFQSLTRMTMSGFILCGFFFVFMPTRYPRPIYPTVDNAFIALGMDIVSSFDTPNNCFPSNHVFMTGVATWVVRSKGSKWFCGYLVWAFLILVSTLTTKQHYIVDLLGGLGVALLMGYLDQRLFTRSLTRIQPTMSG